MQTRKLSRRDLLKSLSFAATSAALAACVPPPAVEKPADQAPFIQRYFVSGIRLGALKGQAGTW